MGEKLHDWSVCACELLNKSWPASRGRLLSFLDNHVLVFLDILLFRHHHYYNCMALKIEIVFKTSARMKISRSLKLITDHKAELLFNYRPNTNEKKIALTFSNLLLWNFTSNSAEYPWPTTKDHKAMKYKLFANIGCEKSFDN